MNYTIDKENKTPLYIQLYESLKRDIVNGVYPYNSKLPSKRTIKDETGISIISVEHALSLLIEEGYIEPKEKSGYYVIFNRKNINNKPIFNTEIGKIESKIPANHGDFPISVLSKTIRKVILDYQEEILIKSSNKGLLKLREEISSYLARSRGINVSPERIIIGSGAEYLYGLIAQLFDKDITIAIEDPSYSKIYDVYHSLNKNVVKLPLGKDGINIDDLAKSQASILHVTPFHSFPSGISISASKKHSYLEWANNESDRYIIEDNYDSELTVSSKNEDSLFAISNSDNVIYINTFSKTIAPSFRIGYMLLPERLLETFESKLGFYSCTVSTYTQLVIYDLLRNGDFERHINRVRRNKRRISRK